MKILILKGIALFLEYFENMIVVHSFYVVNDGLCMSGDDTLNWKRNCPFRLYCKAHY